MDRDVGHEAGDDGKGRQHVIRHLMDRAIAAHLETLAVDDDHLAIEILKRP
jgi:hypothetical protein